MEEFMWNTIVLLGALQAQATNAVVLSILEQLMNALTHSSGLPEGGRNVVSDDYYVRMLQSGNDIDFLTDLGVTRSVFEKICTLLERDCTEYNRQGELCLYSVSFALLTWTR
jgi:hypothetical protein